jgi:hypothetical protein
VTLRQPIAATPYFEGPRPSIVTETVAVDDAILDPYSVATKGEDVLRRSLGALRGRHLRNIVRAYRLADESLDLEELSEPELVNLIVAAVNAV